MPPWRRPLMHSVRQLRRDLISGGRLFVRGIVGHHLVPDSDLKTGHADSTRLATGYGDRWHHAE